jgi:hypothetical protein
VKDRIIGASERTQEIATWLVERGVPRQAVTDLVRSAISDGAMFSLTEAKLRTGKDLFGQA